MNGVPNGGFCCFRVFFSSIISECEGWPSPSSPGYFLCFQNGSCSESLWEKHPELCRFRNLAERKPSRKTVLFFFKLWFSLVKLPRELLLLGLQESASMFSFFPWVLRIQTRVHMLVRQVFYQLSHLPASLFGACPACNLSIWGSGGRKSLFQGHPQLCGESPARSTWDHA